MSDPTTCDPPPSNPQGLLRFTLWGVLVVGAFWLLIIGKGLLIPLVLAVLIWYTVEALSAVCARIPVAGKSLPGWSCNVLAILLIGLVIYGFFSLIAANVTQMTASADSYEERLNELCNQGLALVGIEENNLMDAIMERIDFAATAAAVGSILGSLLGDSVLIAMYVIFLLIERRVFAKKFDALFENEARRNSVRSILTRIDAKIKVYLGVKVLASLLTAVLAYVIMKFVDLDFAGFWAVLIFVFNFIPYVGSAVATILPTILALIQFDTFGPALIVLIGIQCVQLAVGNLVEPTMMGRTLNISPMGVLLSLTLWGIVWGILGMLLSVPIAVIFMIISAEFDSTRWFAILLSKDGSLTEEKTT